MLERGISLKRPIQRLLQPKEAARSIRKRLSTIRSQKPPLPGHDSFISNIPYEIREEIVFWALLTAPRLAATTFASLSLVSHVWRLHALRLEFLSFSFNASPPKLEGSRRRLKRLREHLQGPEARRRTGQNQRAASCRALFLRMPYASHTHYTMNEDIAEVLGLVGPTLWSLEIQGGFGNDPYLGMHRDHTAEEKEQAFLLGSQFILEEHRFYTLPLLQRLWVSDLPPKGTIALIRATGKHEDDCHRGSLPGVAPRPHTISVKHAFESEKAHQLYRLPTEVLGPPKMPRKPKIKITKAGESDKHEALPRPSLDVYIDRRLDVVYFLHSLRENGLPAGIQTVHLRVKGEPDVVPGLSTLIRDNDWNRFKQ